VTYEELESLRKEQMDNWLELKELLTGRLSDIERRLDSFETERGRPAAPGSEPAVDEDGLPLARGLLRPRQKVLSLVENDLPDNAKPHEFSLGRWLKGVVTGDWQGADLELGTVKTRALGTSDDTAGGYLLPSVVSAEIIDLARAAATFVRSGAQTIPLTDSNKAFPTLEADPTAYWKDENDTITESAPTFGRILAAPKTVTCLIKASVELIEDAGPVLDRFLNEVLSRVLANEVDRVAYFGQNSGNLSEPLGIWNWSGVQSQASGGSNYIDDTLDAAKLIYDQNFAGDYSDLSLVTTPAVMTAIAEMKSTTSEYLLPAREFGAIKRFQTKQMPENLGAGSNEHGMIVGHFPSAALLVRTPIRIEATRAGAGAMERLQIVVRAYLRADIIPFQPQWFCKITGVTP